MRVAVEKETVMSNQSEHGGEEKVPESEERQKPTHEAGQSKDEGDRESAGSERRNSDAEVHHHKRTYIGQRPDKR